jgi:hypothetical protein
MRTIEISAVNQLFRSYLDADKLIRSFLDPDFGLRSMPRHYDRGILQGIQTLSNGLLDGFEVSAPEIGTPDTATKERVASQDQIVAGKMKTRGTGGMARRMKGDSGELANR